MKVILIMGLPGSGKTTFAKRVQSLLPNSVLINADNIRTLYNDWDFSIEGRLRQAYRMRDLADQHKNNIIIDMVCPLPEMRNIINADIVVWMDTIQSGRFEDTNKLFVQPKNYDYRISNLTD